MEETATQESIPMEGRTARAGKILRKSIHVFLQHYHYFTLASALISFPYSLSFLLSSSSSSSSTSLVSSLYTQFNTLFEAARFPPSGFFSIANLKLSQTLSSSILTLPFTLTFLLLTKASIIQSLNWSSSPSPSLASTYFPILKTYICTWLVLVSANATGFFLLFFAFSSVENLFPSWPTLTVFFSGASAILYSIILANTIIVCNMGIIVSGVERLGGSLAIIKAFIMIKGRASTALSLAVPLNIALAATEALFQFRVLRAFHSGGAGGFLVILEGLFIAYLYSVLVVLETIVNLMLFRECRVEDYLAELEDKCHYWQIRMPSEEFNFPDPMKIEQMAESPL